MQAKKKTKASDSDGSASEKKTKVHAQRKFAQGAYNFAALKEKEKENGICNNVQNSTHVDPPNEDLMDVCPSTEDFLTFLCYRSLPGILPESLNYFADPIRHNYPDGVLPSESKPVQVKTKHKENGFDDAHEKFKVPNNVARRAKKELLTMHKQSPAVNAKGLRLARIHSNFRRKTVNSGVITRLGRTQPISKDKAIRKKNIVKNSKATKTKLLPKRIETRSLRKARSDTDSHSSSSSENGSSESDSSDEDEELPKVAKKKLANMKKKKTSKPPEVTKANKKKAIEQGKKSLKATSNRKNTRASSAVQSPTKPLSLIKASSQRFDRASRRQSRRGAGTPEPAETRSQVRARLRSAPSSESVSHAKPDRKSPEKVTTRRTAPQTVVSPNRRPMRRTKEAATIYMTILGQEEELDSSELEDGTRDKGRRGEKRSSNVIRNKPTNGRKQDAPSEPVTTRTRRNCVSATNSPVAKRRATILREAARRFTAAQSDTQSSSSPSSSEYSSSDEEVSVPKRSIRTRSFDPSQSKQSPFEAPAPIGRRRSEREAPSKVLEKKKSARIRSNSRLMNGNLEKKSVEKKPQEKNESEKPEPKARKRTVSKRPQTPQLNNDLKSLLEAPVFYPSEKEFSDPMEYLEKIRPECERFGICRIIPPVSFKPECQVSDAMRFTAYNQYVHKMFRRKGPNARILQAIHRHLKSMGIDYQQAPCIGGIEIDLPGLYEAVEELGGPCFVLQNNLWSKVADKLKIPRAAQDRLSKLDSIYCKYLLPYATMSTEEKSKLLQKVDAQLARKPSGDEEDECVVKGSSVALSSFYRIARNTLSVWFPNVNSAAADVAVDPVQVEAKYWQLATERTAHLCVHCGNIDSGQAGYGFPCNKTSRHPWNLKVLTNNTGSVLRSLGSVAGCTAPTLHVGMLFSASCWYRDPHGLPWIDYLHTGADKIWYGVPSCQEPILRRAMTKFVPDLVNSEKSVWLSSDTVMIPPTMLADEGVSLSRTIQKSGQFIVVWPQAFTSSLSTGYSVSENVYFAPSDWLPIGESCFKELRENCEPTVFSLQQLLWNIAHDNRSSADVLKRVMPMLQHSIDEELELRSSLRNFGVQQWEEIRSLTENGHKGDTKKRRQQVTVDESEMECDECRASLFFSRAEYQTQSKPPVTWCLSHALEKIKDRPRTTQHVKVFYAHDQKELREAMQRMKDHVRAKSMRGSASQRTVTV